MTTRVDDSRSSLRGSYFELLYEKYPDLAPAVRPAASAARNPERSAGTSQRGFESLWVPGLLLVVLALALIFPPALLWEPSWLSAWSQTDGTTTVTAQRTQATELQASVALAPAPESMTAETTAGDGIEAVAVNAGDLLASKEREMAALVAAERRAVAASAARRQSSQEAFQPADVSRDLTDTGQILSAQGPAVPRTAVQNAADPGAAAQVSLVAESSLPEPSLAEVALSDVAETPAADFLEVATAGPRIQPARRLQGEAPQVAAVEQPTRLRLRNHINPLGEVVGVDILQGLSQEHDRLMADALRQWRYEPATVDGRPVSSQQEVVFVLMPGGETQLAKADPVEPARRRLTPLPGYTQEAWIQGTEGEVELLASIDARGDVTEVEVVSGLPHGLTQSAVQAVERWKFDPARQRGEAVASTQRLRLRFAL